MGVAMFIQASYAVVLMIYSVYYCILAKNVATEIADKLCGSVVTKLEGKTIGTFKGTNNNNNNNK